MNFLVPAIGFEFAAFRVNFMTQGHSNYKWMGLGDVNGFFGLMFDNIAQLSFLAGTLIVGFNFPSRCCLQSNDSGNNYGGAVR